ncbi:MAG TPA: CDP-diacylglycerol--glycerol-3-phosphate 3-phosphatidyltransferase [Caldithrix abyssi]|uniref:CDP-diacylglycerol--glycerol-3-phosphate 3-phosphatidyltransferase n=1 Tax=Caldithrix abyssi TaxID=187145 RepID=A0A7V4WTT0_CALAY|nr:CDP-diacylglycerol--glycerol-3-phosphate 3-phosphatidyltransferase [Caldithrix abyssi]
MNFTIPNQLTLIRIALTPLFAFYFLQGKAESTLIATIIFFVASFTDWYDGYIARRFNLITRWGQFMDPLADKILISTVLVCFAIQDLVFWWMILVIVIRDAIVTFLRSFALSIGKPIITSVLAKWKTFLQMFATFAILVYINFPQLPSIHLADAENPWLLWTTLLFSVVVLLTTISGIQYLIVNREHLVALWQRLFKELERDD